MDDGPRSVRDRLEANDPPAVEGDDAKMEKAIGELICRLNPYTKEMDIFVGNPGPPGSPNKYRQVELEIDDKYADAWAFKGQPQRINRSFRIKYRYPKKDDNGNILYWLVDYLLVGYEGAGGGA
jgi:hypothetical protein